MTSEQIQHRCAWAEQDPLMRAYHDQEWGVPEHGSRALWEKLMLDGFQAGLSWITILRKRDAFRQAFQDFDPEIVARFGAEDIERLLADPGIVRSRAKIEATIGNARAYLAMAEAGEDFSTFVWASMRGCRPRALSTIMSSAAFGVVDLVETCAHDETELDAGSCGYPERYI